MNKRIIVTWVLIIMIYLSSYVPIHYICHNDLGRSDLFTHTTRIESILGIKSGYTYTIVNNNETYYIYGYSREIHQEECFKA